MFRVVLVKIQGVIIIMFGTQNNMALRIGSNNIITDLNMPEPFYLSLQCLKHCLHFCRIILGDSSFGFLFQSPHDDVSDHLTASFKYSYNNLSMIRLKPFKRY